MILSVNIKLAVSYCKAYHHHHHFQHCPVSFPFFLSFSIKIMFSLLLNLSTQMHLHVCSLQGHSNRSTHFLRVKYFPLLSFLFGYKGK